MGTKCVVFTSDKGDVTADLAFFNNYAATTAPGASNDMTQGYRRGSRWQNQSASPIALYECVTDTAGAAVWVQVETGGAEGVIVAPAGANASITGGGPATATSAGQSASVIGGAGGATSGEGGPANLTGGAAAGGNSNGGPAVIAGGAANGSGQQGPVIERGNTVLRSQGAAAAVNATANLTAAQLIGGIITSTTAAAVTMTLPLQSAMDAALPDAVAGDSLDFSIINIGTSNAVTVALNSWTNGGSANSLNVPANSATVSGSARFRAAKTGAGAWTLFRLS